ncbi:MAG: hypothetical protein J0H91_19380, partial [Rhodospirillales bacterium]|nr:hypothetical protein [Rhodospirillales bacterium]
MRFLPFGAGTVGVAGAGVKQGQGSLLFVNKKKQKNFIHWSPDGDTEQHQTDGSFLVLFFKKEPLPTPET